MKLDKIWLCDLSTVHRNLYTQVQAWLHLSNSHILDVSEETGQWSFAAAACLKFVAACSSWPVPLKEMEQISKSFQAAGTAEAIIPATVGWLLMRVHWPGTKWLLCWWQRVRQDRGGPGDWQRKWQFEGGSGHFSRFEHQKPDRFISMKISSGIFRLIRPFARDCCHSELWHLMWLWCHRFRFTQGTKKGKIIYCYVV